jgi:ZIP family zinc transporter
VTAALLWGALAGSSLLVGALLGVARTWPRRLVGLVLAFGAGALIASVAFELAEEGVRTGGPVPVAVGIALGALAFTGGNHAIQAMGARRHRGHPDREVDDADGSGAGLALGAFLDGIPEQAVLGIGLASGGGVSVALLVAVWVSNLPEGIGSAADMRRTVPRRSILLLWLGVTVVCALATLGGYALADICGEGGAALISGFAAGALLVMLVDEMIPEARSAAGPMAGLVTVVGFALAAGLSTLS